MGHRFRGGDYDLAGYESWLWADAVTATPDPAVAHPGMAFMLSLLGARSTVADILELLGAATDSGVMFGECALELHAPIPAAGVVHAEGEVVAVERKRGRWAGLFDLATFEHRLTEADGAPLVTMTHSWVFPREEDA